MALTITAIEELEINSVYNDDIKVALSDGTIRQVPTYLDFEEDAWREALYRLYVEREDVDDYVVYRYGQDATEAEYKSLTEVLNDMDFWVTEVDHMLGMLEIQLESLEVVK